MNSVGRHKGSRRWQTVLSLLFCLLFTISCSQDSYDKGEGEYSLMQGDFVEAHTNGQKHFDYVITDAGERLSLSPTVSTKWGTTADSLYRCILYYNKVVSDKGGVVAEPISLQQVVCLQALSLSSFSKPVKDDPVRFESAWISKSGQYLNLSLYLMMGSAGDEKAIHSLNVLCDTVMANPDATRTSFLRLHHDQGGIPEYYSAQFYASIPMADIQADTIRLKINTYSGLIEKTLIPRK